MSLYSPSSQHKVYGHPEWISDDWNAEDYAQEFDFNQPFFCQFQELNRNVPHLGQHLQNENENCDFTNLVSRNKNCYYIFAASDNEDCMYTTYIHRSKDVIDCFFIFDSQECYECIDCYHCYNLKHSIQCTNCNDSQYLVSCKGCNNCFGCVSLANQEYCIFNQRVSKEKYHSFVREVLERPDAEEFIRAQLDELCKDNPQKSYAGINNESVHGDHISYSKNIEHCFDCTYLEDCRYCTWLHRSSDCMDCYAWGLTGELGYESHLCGNNFYRVLFSDCCWNDISNLLYCRYCVGNVHHCFGCVGLKKKEYCILNKQYSKEEYEQLVPKIVEHMKETGEWGEFFPTELSSFAYNETVAQEYFPMAREEVLNHDWSWNENLPRITGKQTVDWNNFDRYARNDSDVNEIYSCSCCAKNYRITSEELKFYRLMDLPIPNRCFDCRYEARRNRRNPRNLWQRECDCCNSQIESSFSPNSPELVYCEPCYQQEVF